MTNFRLSCGLFVIVSASSSQALQFSGASYFALGPSTQAGTFANNLVLADTIGGFTITGQFIVNVANGSSSGTLLEWQVRRPISATSPAGAEVFTVGLTGFIDAPTGNGGGSGFLSGGIFDGATMSLITYAGVSFSHTGAGVVNYNLSNINQIAYNGLGLELVQNYFVDYSYSGTGGTYILDFPADTNCVPVPEPATCAVVGLGALALVRKRKQ